MTSALAYLKETPAPLARLPLLGEIVTGDLFQAGCFGGLLFQNGNRLVASANRVAGACQEKTSAARGWIGSMIMKTGGGVLFDIIIGIIGALIGGFIMNAFGQAGVTGFNLYFELCRTDCVSG